MIPSNDSNRKSMIVLIATIQIHHLPPWGRHLGGLCDEALDVHDVDVDVDDRDHDRDDDDDGNEYDETATKNETSSWFVDVTIIWGGYVLETGCDAYFGLLDLFFMRVCESNTKR